MAEYLLKVSNEVSSLAESISDNLRKSLSPSPQSAKLVRVAVTGGTGYLGARVVESLLKYEDPKVMFQVVCIVRNMKERFAASSNIVDVLESLEGAKGRLVFAEGSLVDENHRGLDTAMLGCRLVVHCAGPNTSSMENAQGRIIVPTVVGTRLVLAAARKCMVDRVVVTSSLLALQEGRISASSFPYAYSKKMALSEVDRFREQFGDEMEVVTLHPGLLLGPALSKYHPGESVSLMCKLMIGQARRPSRRKGSGACASPPDRLLGVADVRDVALAHVHALLCPNPMRSYKCVSEVMTLEQLTDMLRSNPETQSIMERTGNFKQDGLKSSAEVLNSFDPASLSPQLEEAPVEGGGSASSSRAEGGHHQQLHVGAGADFKPPFTFTFRPVTQTLADMTNKMLADGQFSQTRTIPQNSAQARSPTVLLVLLVSGILSATLKIRRKCTKTNSSDSSLRKFPFTTANWYSKSESSSVKDGRSKAQVDDLKGKLLKFYPIPPHFQVEDTAKK